MGIQMASEFNRFRGSSKYYLVLHFLNMTIYNFGVVLQMFKTEHGIKKMGNIPAFLACFMKVCEREMLFTFLMHFICILTVSFHIFGALISTITAGLPYALVLTYMMPDGDSRKNRLLIFEGINVAIVFCNFMMLFASDMYFDIAEDLEEWN